MDVSGTLLFRKLPVTLICDPESNCSTISVSWLNENGLTPTSSNRVYGFLTLQSPHGALHMHLSLGIVSDGAYTITLGGDAAERYSALEKLHTGDMHESVPLFLSRGALHRQLHTQSPWLHVTESIIYTALHDMTRSLLVALLNKMQTIMLRPLTTPLHKSEAVNAILSVYRAFLELCRASDPNDLCAMLGLSVELADFPTPHFIHTVFSSFLGPGICRTILRLYRMTLAPLAPARTYDTLLQSLRLIPHHELRQLLAAAGCPSSSKSTKDLALSLGTSFVTDIETVRTLSDEQLLLFLMSVKPDINILDVLGQNKDSLHDLYLRSRWGTYLLACFRLRFVLFPDLMRSPRQSEGTGEQDDSSWARTVAEVEDNWPTLPSRTVIHNCMINYRNALEVTASIICAVCSRQSHRLSVAGYCLTPKSVLQGCLPILQVTDPHLQKYFRSNVSPSANVKIVKGAILDTRGVVKYADLEVVQICKDCVGALLCHKIPRHSLANNLYVGELPSEFYDVTWAEEQICALFRLHAYIVRLFASEEAHRKLFGNTCAFPQNTVSTAAALPRTPADIIGNITVVFIGSYKPTTAELLKYKHYTVRRGLVWRLLLYLHEYHMYYQGLPPPRPDLLCAYPEYGLLPGFEDRIIWDRESDPKAVFEQETAGMSAHPATVFASSSTSEHKSDPHPFYLECTGVVDPNLQNIPARHLEQAALSNLAKLCCPDAVLTTDVKPPGTKPDLLISRGHDPVNDYNNPGLFPGMFPTLFPLGIGGFEDPFRPVKLNFLRQAEHFLDLATRSFRRHPTYIFAALNIHQHREVNLRTYLAISRQSFRHIAPRLNAVSSSTLDQLATRIEQENWATNLSSKESEAMYLFRQVNTIAAKIPGSEAMKSHLRGNIRAYFQFFGTAHLFLTINPSPIHSPVFHFMMGDHSIDLTTQYPILPSRHIRALRVAEDPMEAADFFQWSLDIIYEHLFGWDKAKQRSRPEGGILGFLQAIYIINELTERGFFHAHGLMWLLGAPNPAELHARLSCPDFQRRFFDFYESIIYNHFPDVDVAMPASYNCSQELPPRPPPFEEIADETSPAAQRWQQRLAYETKICAVDCQLHKCRPVCHKYKNDGVCRFNFPQEVVPKSHYDPERHAVVMRLLDPWVNFYNPILIAFCRHNHDLKCMLSGRACRAGMIYITNYITKMEFKTQHALSLLSKAVVAAQGVEGSPVRQAQVLLQKCLTQFNRRQQVHAQQACRYIRGYNDALPSHKMLPLLSHLLLALVSEVHPALTEPGRTSDIYVPLIRTDNGNFRETSQVEDYYYRGDSLQDMNFYNFVRLTECVKKGSEREELKANHHYVELKKAHQLANTHHLLVRQESATPFCGNVRVPIMVGTFPPRQSSSKYPLFVAAHFKPFGPDTPLAETPKELVDTIKDYAFNEIARTVMKNWEAFHECEDERDAERLRKRERHAHVTVNDLPRWEQKDVDHQDSVVFDISSVKQTSTRQEQASRELISTFHLANWFETQGASGTLHQASPTIEGEKLYDLSTANVKQWLHTLAEADKAAKFARRTASTTQPALQLPAPNVNATVIGATDPQWTNRTVQTTIVVNESRGQDVKEIESQLIKNFQLNERQTIAFKIIASQFLSRYVYKEDTPDPPLNLLLTGPGGTGKSHVIKALKDLMKHYGLGHAIRLLAPTGSTASVIAGMTIHSGLKIGFKTSRIEGEDTVNIQYTTSVLNRRLLREEFKDAKVIFIDEVSLIPQELVAEVDAALREATENDQWMGGLMIIYAGDFGQYPPVGGTPLYHPIRSGVRAQSASQIKARLGRLSWKQVNAAISLSEQQRMKGDAQYAAAVSRLRLRCCLPEDVELFNSRVLKGLETPEGVDLGESPYIDKGIAIVDTNHARQMLNFHKTRAAALRENQPLILCAARDTIKDNEIDAAMRDELLNMEISTHSKSDFLPGFIPCYVGMKIILRHKNLSTELGITNGSQGILRQMQIDTDSYGHSFCSAALVEFSESTVDIPDLPKKWVPILPRSCRFKVQLSNSDDQVWVTRTQLPISPAFAVTGHSSQGKTLPVVITNLKSGGFAAYVAASRPTSRFGLVITERVTLEDLNKPLPIDLRDENDRLHALEHNTLVKFGFLPGPPVVVPDAEGETQALPLSRSAEHGTKRKRGEQPLNQHLPDKRPRKAGRTGASANAHAKELSGPLWDRQNWSCAYDAFLPSILAHLRAHPQSTTIGHLRSILGEPLTKTLLEFSSHWEQLSCAHLTRLRDHLKDLLSEWRPHLFPRAGQVMISASHLFELLLPLSAIQLADGGTFTLPQLLYHPPDRRRQEDDVIDLQSWLLHRLPSARETPIETVPLDLPSLLQFEVVPPLSVKIPMTLTLFETEYSLCAAIYHGDGHYDSYFQFDGTWFYHDGIAHDGRAVAQSSFPGSIGLNGKSINLITYQSNRPNRVDSTFRGSADL